MTSTNKANITVLISGSGTNLQALINATKIDPPHLPHAQITHVISNRKSAFGLTRAKDAGIATSYHNLQGYKKNEEDTAEGVKKARLAYDQDLAKLITLHDPKPDLVVCAGWMHILSAGFIDELTKADVKIINLHPALPGQFNGANAIQRAFTAFQRGEIVATGVMIHYVIGEVDMGEPIVTQEIEIEVDDTESSLEARIHESEWKLIVQGTGKVVDEIVIKKKNG